MLAQAAETAQALIPADATWVLWSIILVGVAASIWLEQTYRWAARLSGPVLGLLMGMTLSTVGVMPTAAPVYDFVTEYLIPMAIPLLLFQANLLRIIRVTGRMFLAFHLAVVGTVLGAIVATFLMRANMSHAPEIGGIMTASYSGGGVNFAAVKTTYADVVSDELTNPLLVADNFIMAGMFMVLLVIAGSHFFLRRYPHPSIVDADSEETRAAAAAHWHAKPISLRDIAMALAVAFAIATVARELAATLGARTSGVLASLVGNKYVWITALSLTVATVFHRPLGRVNGADTLGGYALYIFLFVIGLPANLIAVLSKAPEMFVYCGIIAVVNLALTLALGKLLRLNLEDLLVSVNATLGGPPSAVAMAVSKGWPKLVLPAMLVGIWGYVIGTPIGVMTTEMLRAMFGP